MNVVELALMPGILGCGLTPLIGRNLLGRIRAHARHRIRSRKYAWIAVLAVILLLLNAKHSVITGLLRRLSPSLDLLTHGLQRLLTEGAAHGSLRR
jgi:uncharacterized membrane protein